MIGRVIEYKTDKNTARHGVVIDKISMLHADNQSVVTGYIVQDLNGKATSVGYWKIIKVLESEEDKNEQHESTFSSQEIVSISNSKSQLKQAEREEWIKQISNPLNHIPKGAEDDLPF